MKTVLIKKIDGLDVVAGTSRRYVNQVKSHKSLRNALEKTPEFEQYREAVEKIESIIPANKRNQTDLERFVKQMNNAVSEAKPKTQALRQKEKEITKENKVLFTISDGQEPVSDDEHDEILSLINSLEKGEVLLKDKTKINDKRGVMYFQYDGNDGMTHSIIRKLGDEIPQGAKLQSELTYDDEKKIQRTFKITKIGQLTAEEKTAALEKELNSLSIRLSSGVTAAEVSGGDRAAALQDAQDQYNAQAQEISDLYASA